MEKWTFSTNKLPPGSLCELWRSPRNDGQENVETPPIQSAHCGHQACAQSAQAARPEAVVCRYPDLVVKSHGQQVPPTHLIFHCFDSLQLQPAKEKNNLLSLSTSLQPILSYINSCECHPKTVQHNFKLKLFCQTQCGTGSAQSQCMNLITLLILGVSLQKAQECKTMFDMSLRAKQPQDLLRQKLRRIYIVTLCPTMT